MMLAVLYTVFTLMDPKDLSSTIIPSLLTPQQSHLPQRNKHLVYVCSQTGKKGEKMLLEVHKNENCFGFDFEFFVLFHC
jgi:hypothetical protein